MAGRESDEHARQYVHSSPPSLRSGLIVAVSISLLPFVPALILFLNNALFPFFFNPIFIVGLFFVAVWCSV